jgi:thioredoxin-like negative regulator of GroEL
MELTLEEVLKKGIDAHKAGQIQEADRLYTAILNAQPKHPDANHNMGVLAISML